MNNFRSFVCVCTVEASSYVLNSSPIFFCYISLAVRKRCGCRPTLKLGYCIKRGDEWGEYLCIRKLVKLARARRKKIGSPIECFHSTYKLRTLKVKLTRSPLTVSEWAIKCPSKSISQSYFFPFVFLEVAFGISVAADVNSGFFLALLALSHSLKKICLCDSL